VVGYEECRGVVREPGGSSSFTSTSLSPDAETTVTEPLEEQLRSSEERSLSVENCREQRHAASRPQCEASPRCQEASRSIASAWRIFVAVSKSVVVVQWASSQHREASPQR
jgi:hypothetical protein